ncbi:hypothetical protein W97_02823 [Coniosporium apollinis CBS 100218]|uniref:DUF676 domain-containing protein n=1 Tax=Coniosporium apollinis (strain CBS 100218) TaxID=1168221 RepID=R7YNW9_CONA1|nr:uncharacterized protein W97_02823 [Coniosporium apollinis CBS 100218]EON63595.1 hypothetical protein W97_02823 [Coniosporium apollinis CBS 100218]
MALSIIAVHGLLGDWEHTWTDEGSGNLWLRDFLPSTVPSARIWSYGYDSSIVFSQSINEIDVEARSLLDRLQGVREETRTPEKPIIFISHSLGGIIVKKALILAHEMSSFYGGLLSHVHAVVFFGVPHSGSDAAVWGNFIARLLKLTPLPVNTNFIGPLQRNSSAFRDISRQFIQRGSQLVIRTFFETKKIGNQVIVSRESASLNLPNELALAIPQSDHRDLCRFSNVESQKYAPVRRAIRNLIDSALSASQTALINSASSASPKVEPTRKVEEGAATPKAKEEIQPLTSLDENIPAIFLLVLNGNAYGIKQLLDHVDKSQVHAVFKPLKYGSQPLHIAAIKGDAEIARILLERGASPTALSLEHGCTALHYAVDGGFFDVVDEILHRDDNGQLMYPVGDTINLSTPLNHAPPLVFAAQNGFTRIVQALLEAGADPNVHGINGANGLHVAGGQQFDDIVAALLQAGADPNKANPEGITPLHVVNSARSAEMLIDAGSNLSATIYSKNPYNFTIGATPLRVSVDSGNLAVVEVLARHCTREQLNMKAADRKSALEAAIDPFKSSISKVLFNAFELLLEKDKESVADINE